MMDVARFLRAVEPFWVASATAFIYVVYLFQVGSALISIGLVLAFIPLGIRLVYRHTLELPTSFDLPLAVLMLGAVIGVVVSPMFTMSIGAFQCMLALCFLYYSFVGYPALSKITGTLLLFSLAPLSAAFIVSLIRLDSAIEDSSMVGHTYHGMALALVITASIFAGMAAFARNRNRRPFLILLALCLCGATAYLISESVPRLIGWDSIEGRLPRWEQTIELLREHPITGLGLGGWGYAYHGGEILTHPTHAHNAYLELYANTGLFGALALVVALVVGARLAWRIIRSPRNHPWYGFGVGVVIACVATLLVGVVESAPTGVPLVAEDTYYYLISPVPWILAGLLVAAKDLLGKEMKE